MIIFRADGNSNIGLGHIMRCLSIADTYKKYGEECTFVASDKNARQIVEGRGFSLLSLDSDYRNLNNEIEVLINCINKKSVSTIIIDSYFVTKEYLNEIWLHCHNNGIVLVYIDDLYSFPYKCDVLINYNIYACKEDYERLYLADKLPKLLLGTKYVPLREEFSGPFERINKPADSCRDILISTGGADSHHIGKTIIDHIISDKKWDNYNYHIVIGGMNTDKESIIKTAEGRSNISVYCGVTRMSDLMKSCDIAISASGSTLYELCATQTPIITYVIADNQISGAMKFKELELTEYAGSLSDNNPNSVASAVLNRASELINDYHKRCSITLTMKSLVDGNGASRIIESISMIHNT